MLVASPFRDFAGPPRIISELRKAHDAPFIPSLSGELLVRNGSEKKWWPRRVLVKSGQLQISGGHCEGAPTALRLPLRHLSLRAGSLPNSLSLCKGQSTVLSIQMADERAFDQWVKSIAIELIRQTPLDAVKYLDIFTLARCWQAKPYPVDKDCNSNYLPPTEEIPPVPHEDVVIEKLFQKCQSSDNYVPVREKLLLFESLCKWGRKVRSTEDVSCKKNTKDGAKRARSMHDLSNFQQQSAVREICKYFEQNVKSVNRYGTMTRFAQLGS